ncbi:hypothetical protein AnigIFM56816_009096 [Aspergillus niger]|nr:hypothetical protein AnigIFM56816_009096 [Aspergillus niger]
MTSHRADASTFLDNRGYSGPLVRGVNPATLFEKAVRDRITDSYYWKEQCFGLNAATLCDRAVELTSIGGVYGVSEKPSPFLCLAFKLLQLNPERDIILEYLNFSDPANDEDSTGHEEREHDDGVVKARGDFKYLRALAAFYVRLTFEPVEVYKTLEPLLLDYRKLKRRVRDSFTLTYMDQFVDELLTKERVCGTSLWKLPARQVLEDLDLLEVRVSPLQDELEEMERSDREEEDDDEKDEADEGSEEGERQGRKQNAAQKPGSLGLSVRRCGIDGYQIRVVVHRSCCLAPTLAADVQPFGTAPAISTFVETIRKVTGYCCSYGFLASIEAQRMA